METWKNVLCIETNEIFKSVKEASQIKRLLAWFYMVGEKGLVVLHGRKRKFARISR